jgi:DNA helicase-2/ATP-dependent DNA helicase PcrA
MTEHFLSTLTPPQREAASHIDGPMLVLAGPGSGKTRVITHRVAHLIEQGVGPTHILAITFTNKAAGEMRDRLQAMNIPRGSTICTFHSLASRLLRQFSDLVGLKKTYTIYDTADQKAAIREAIKTLELDSQRLTPIKILAKIGLLKNDLITPQDYAKQEHMEFFNRLVARIYLSYQAHLTANHAVDFDDLLMKLSFLLRDHSDVRDFLNERYTYVLVDEYQDTNQCQYQIARGLSLNHNNLFVTGDPDQSIYAWRGADISNILAFEDDYPNAKTVRLEENFRSIPQVLKLADELIVQNSERKIKSLFTSKPDGETPSLCEYGDEHEEALAMTQWVNHQRSQGLEYRDMAVFYRVNSMSRVLEENLRRHNIPYQIIRGVEFFQRREIKDMLAYLKFIVNPADQISLKRCINQPARGIGATTVGRLVQQSHETLMEIGDVLKFVDDVSSLSAAPKAKIKKFNALIEKFRSMDKVSIENIMTSVYAESGLKAAHGKEVDDDQRDNVEELINSAAQYDLEAEKPSLADYLQQIALISDTDSYDAQAGAVSLMTLHSAKGLEFPAVWITGLEEGLIPHSRSIGSNKEIEEERRLLFVGITRAEQHLSLSYARNRTVHGSPLATIRSEFLRGLESLDVKISSTFSAAFDSTSDSDDWPDSPDDFSESYDEDPDMQFNLNQLVRHPKMGLGRIQELIPSQENSKVIVQFNSGSRKTLVLKYAKLEKLDFPD